MPTEPTLVQLDAETVASIETSLDLILDSDFTNAPTNVINQLISCYGKIFKIVSELPAQKYKTESNNTLV